MKTLMISIRTPFPQVFAIVSAGLFLPVVLETYARQNGVLASGDRSTPCPPSGAADSGEGGEDGLRCVVRLAGTWVDTGRADKSAAAPVQSRQR